MIGINQWEVITVLVIATVVIGCPLALFLIIRAAVRSANKDK
jgi:Sec-independent protein translocase protein TatA